MLCEMSQTTNPNANVIPSANSHQNHRAKRAPARIATPTTMGAIQPVSPRIGFESEDAALPGLEILAALHQESEVARCDRIGVGEQVELLDRELERRPPADRAGDDQPRCQGLRVGVRLRL